MKEISEKEDGLFKELFERMRTNETQAQVLAARLDNVCDRMEGQSKAIENQRMVIDQFLQHLARQEDRSENREQNFWKYIGVLIGAIIALSLGPKVANQLSAALSKDTGGATQVTSCDIWQGDGNRKCWPLIPLKDRNSLI